MRKRPDIPRPPADLKVKRVLNRLIEALGGDGETCVEVTITADAAFLTELLRNEAGEFYEDESGRPAQRRRRLPINSEADPPDPEVP